VALRPSSLPGIESRNPENVDQVFCVLLLSSDLTTPATMHQIADPKPKNSKTAPGPYTIDHKSLPPGPGPHEERDDTHHWDDESEAIRAR